MIKILSKSYSTKKPLQVYSLNVFTNENDNSHIGNKAFSLLRLFQYGFNIPDSIILDYSFFKYFIKHDIIPSELINKILKENLSENLAIRSSCSLEDSYDKSYAGSFKTTLNIPNKFDEIKKAIKECYTSLFKFQKNGSSLEDRGDNPERWMGVIIQSMITPKISGILFTCPPINPDESNYQIEYTSGYGDKLTGSYLSGNSIIVDKSSGKIVLQTGSLTLPLKIINRLWELSKKLDEKFFLPQDAEFVISNTSDDIYFVQTRPITAFNYTPEYVIKKENEKLKNIFEIGINNYGLPPIISHNNISELFPVAVPLGYSIFKYIFAGTELLRGAWNQGRIELGYAPISEMEQNKLFLTIGDQARMNLQIDALTYRLKDIPKDLYINNFLTYYSKIIRDDLEKANYPEFGLYIQYPDQEECVSLFGENGQSIYNYYSCFNDEILNQKIPAILESVPDVLIKNESFYNKDVCNYNDENKTNMLFTRYEDGFLKISKSIELTRLLDAHNKYLDYLRTYLGVEYVKIARIAFLSSYIVKKILSKLVNGFSDLFFDLDEKIQAGGDIGKVNQYFNILLVNENFSDEYKYSKLADYLNVTEIDSTNLTKFRQVFGHLGSFEMSQLRIDEYDDNFLLNLLNDKRNNYFANNKNGGLEWLLHFKEKLEKLKLYSFEEFKNFSSWLQNAKIFLMLRETYKCELLKIIYLIRMIVKEIAGRKNFGDLIYYLHYDELERLIEQPSEYRYIAIKRKAYFEACRNIEVNKFILQESLSNITIKKVSFEEGRGIYETVNGTTIYHGEAEGICLIARNSSEYYAKLIKYRKDGIKNIIGVFSGLEPGYFNLRELKGIVTEHGGFLAHAGTIARENKIPYISDIDIESFQDGQYIVFDTSNNQIIYRQ